MWINLFTVALAIALGCGAAALVLQNYDWQTATPRQRRVSQRRLTRVRG